MKDDGVRLLLGDCLELMKELEDESVDACITDPPAGIGFMNKDWDKDKGGRTQWIAWLASVMTKVNRILKPGGHALVWSLPRTSHWTGMALEDAGFEVRDCIYHLFGSGFPKSLDVSKRLDLMAGVEREVVGKSVHFARRSSSSILSQGQKQPIEIDNRNITLPTTEAAKQWQGWGTALKPAVEQWWLVRKPLSEKTVADNVLKWGTGGINIAECRIQTSDDTNIKQTTETPRFSGRYNNGKDYHTPIGMISGNHYLGRFPANLTHDGSECVLKEFPKVKSGGKPQTQVKKDSNVPFGGKFRPEYTPYWDTDENNEGSAARFFYCAKPSPSERNAGLDGFKEVEMKRMMSGGNDTRGYPVPINKNHHPTVKSIKLMEYFITLITPPNGLVIDPFMGSGTTGIACRNLNRRFIGMELHQDYFDIARGRILGEYPEATDDDVTTESPVQPVTRQLRLL